MWNDDPLPTQTEQEHLCELIQRAFVEIRVLGWHGKAQQAADLADTFHKISREMYGWGTFSWGRFRRDLSTYEERYANADPRFQFLEYTEMLDDLRHSRPSQDTGMSYGDPIPTETQRIRLGEMIQQAFLEIRSLGWAGPAQQAADLADTFHNISREMYGWGTFSWRMFRQDLFNYQKRYATPSRYTTMLDDSMREVE